MEVYGSVDMTLWLKITSVDKEENQECPIGGG